MDLKKALSLGKERKFPKALLSDLSDWSTPNIIERTMEFGMKRLKSFNLSEPEISSPQNGNNNAHLDELAKFRMKFSIDI